MSGLNRLSGLTARAFLPLTAAAALSACVGGTDGERALVGAVGGAVAGEVLFDEPLAGAAVGGAAGYFCRDMNVPGCR